MSQPAYNQSSFDALMQRLCDERLTEADRDELTRLLHESEDARRRYVQFVHLSVSLADWSLAGSRPENRDPADQSGVFSRYPQLGGRRACRSRAVAPTVIERAGAGRSAARLAWLGLSASIATAAVALIAVSLGGLPGGLSDSGPRVAAPFNLPPISNVADRQMFVARVVETTHDAEWDVNAMPSEFLMRLRTGDVLHLKQGLAKVEFYSGAKLILHGPVRFEPTGQTAGYLHAGSISGRVDNGDFLLVTPTAEVIDLGTEFGVTVGQATDTDVLVFDGEVSVRSDHSDPRVMNESVNLTQGMTVRVGQDGVMAGDSAIGADHFSRRFAELAAPSEDTSELSLVDILCGGSGRGQRLAAAIDPLTGDWDRLGWQKSRSPGTRKGNEDFHVSESRPMIDGAFIPASDGSPQRVDSLGRRVSLPKAHGAYTWGPVWARRFTRDLAVLPDRDKNDFWGAETFPVITGRLADSKYGGIGIHASVGVTFDLKDVRSLHSAEIESFSAVLTNLDNSEAHNPEYAHANDRSANFFVVVDGEIRYQQLAFRRNVNGVAFTVPIDDGDRMLTLISTDDNNTNKYDHIVLIDPVLTLRSDPQALRMRRAEALLSAF